MSECSLLDRLYGRQPLLGATLSSLTAAAAASMSKESAAAVIVASLAGYLVLSILESRWRILFLASAVSAHLVAVLLYYTNPIPLPLLLLERSEGNAAVNIDVVQIVVLAEIASALSGSGKAVCTEAGKPGEEAEGEAGETPSGGDSGSAEAGNQPQDATASS